MGSRELVSMLRGYVQFTKYTHTLLGHRVLSGIRSQIYLVDTNIICWRHGGMVGQAGGPRILELTVVVIART